MSCHPAIAATVYRALLTATADSAVDNTPRDTETPVPAESAETTCTTELVAANLNRIRLRGPETAQALLSILQGPADAANNSENSAKLAFFRAVMSVRDVSKHFEDGDVVSLNLRDPRLNTVPIKTLLESQPKTPQAEQVAALKRRPAELAADSPLYHNNTIYGFQSEHPFNQAKHTEKVRRWESLFKTTQPFGEATNETVADSQAGSVSSESAPTVPGTTCPVLFIRKCTPFRSFKTQKHRLSGWDIVLPQAWDALVFRTLQLRGGAAAVGSEEMDHLLAKSGTLQLSLVLYFSVCCS